MEHVVTKPTPAFTNANGRLTVHQLTAWRDNFVWVLVCNETSTAAAVDGPNADAALDFCEKHGLTLSVILNTHTHGDHIGINRDLATRGLLDTMRVYGKERSPGSVPGLTDPVDDGDVVHIGNVRGKVLLTEGHIDSHVSFLFDDVLFCGATLFGAGCGYLFDGPPSKMKRSLDRLAMLPESTRVCCAHEYTQDNLRFAWSVEPNNPALIARIQTTWRLRETGQSSVPSTIGLERETNPFLRHHSVELQSNVKHQLPVDEDTPTAWFAATRRLKDLKHYKTMPDNALPLRRETPA